MRECGIVKFTLAFMQAKARIPNRLEEGEEEDEKPWISGGSGSAKKIDTKSIFPDFNAAAADVTDAAAAASSCQTRAFLHLGVFLSRRKENSFSVCMHESFVSFPPTESGSNQTKKKKKEKAKKLATHTAVSRLWKKIFLRRKIRFWFSRNELGQQGKENQQQHTMGKENPFFFFPPNSGALGRGGGGRRRQTRRSTE